MIHNITPLWFTIWLFMGMLFILMMVALLKGNKKKNNIMHPGDDRRRVEDLDPDQDDDLRPL